MQVEQPLPRMAGGAFKVDTKQPGQGKVGILESDDTIDGGMTFEHPHPCLARHHGETPSAPPVPVVEHTGREDDVTKGAQTEHDP